MIGRTQRGGIKQLDFEADMDDKNDLDSRAWECGRLLNLLANSSYHKDMVVATNGRYASCYEANVRANYEADLGIEAVWFDSEIGAPLMNSQLSKKNWIYSVNKLARSD